MKDWIEDDNINYEYIIRYIRETIPETEGHIREMEIFAKENDVPISQPESIRMIEILIKMMNAKKILEIGAAIGYSSIRMSLANNARVTTIEISDEMAEIAKENIKKEGLEGKIQLITGDAKDILPEIKDDGTYDIIFIDAAKGQYMEFFPHCMRLLRKGGVLISDNVLYKGMTATDELVVRRKITIVRRLRAYLKMLNETKELSTAILPIGDGVAISFKG